MASQLHTYTARVSWSGGREGSGSIQNDNSGQGYDIRVPTEFGGPGGALNPEELLTDAIAGCYSITYGIVVANRRLPVKGVEVQAVGTVDQSGANFVYKSIALSPKITLGAEATDQDIATAIDMAHKADAYCIVTNAIRDKVEVSIAPTVQREGEAAQETKPVSGDQTLDSPYVATGATTVTGSTASTSSENSGNASASASQPSTGAPAADNSTAPPDAVSYEGDPQAEEVYGSAGDAAKPNSATSESGAAPAANGTEAGSTSSESTGSAVPLSDDSDGVTGSNPENEDADDVTASSQQTGNPDSMQVGAVPG
ncbi:hypothetical protein EON79_18815 [bacterium]|nr:MAG: hypothetical protein EON79_18815 [bacterium]